MSTRSVWRFLQISSRYDRSPRSLARVIRALMAHRQFAGLTEVGDHDRATLGRIAAESIGFRWLQVTEGEKGCNENALIVPADAEVLYLAAVPVTKKRFRRKGGQLRAVTHAIAAVIEYDGERQLLSECHTPSGRTKARALAWTSVQRGWSKWIAELEREWAPDDVLCGMDGNRNFFLREWRRVVARVWHRGLRLTVGPRHMPRKGTHGRRLYDVVLTRSSTTVISVQTLANELIEAASDHDVTEVVVAR